VSLYNLNHHGHSVVRALSPHQRSFGIWRICGCIAHLGYRIRLQLFHRLARLSFPRTRLQPVMRGQTKKRATQEPPTIPSTEPYSIILRDANNFVHRVVGYILHVLKGTELESVMEMMESEPNVQYFISDSLWSQRSGRKNFAPELRLALTLWPISSRRLLAGFDARIIMLASLKLILSQLRAGERQECPILSVDHVITAVVSLILLFIPR